MTTGSVEAVAPQAAAFRKAIGSLGLDPKSPILPFAVFSLPAGPGAKVLGRDDMDTFKKEWEAWVMKLRFPPRE